MHFEIDHFRNLRTSVTLIMDRVLGLPTTYRRMSLIHLYLHAKFRWNRINFLWTYVVRADGRTVRPRLYFVKMSLRNWFHKTVQFISSRPTWYESCIAEYSCTSCPWNRCLKNLSFRQDRSLSTAHNIVGSNDQKATETMGLSSGDKRTTYLLDDGTITVVHATMLHPSLAICRL